MFSLHTHSNYTLLKSTITIDEIITHAKNNNLNFASLTDLNGMYGLIQFAKKANENNLKPVLGAEIDDPQNQNLSIQIFAKNNEGYSLLCKIITARKLKQDFSIFEIFERDIENLFIITNSIEILERVKFHNRRGNIFAGLIVTKKQKNHTRKVYEFAKENNFQIVASHPAYFLNKEDFILHKIVTAIRLNKSIENLNDDEIVDEEFFLPSIPEFQNTWKNLPEALQSIDFIVQNCNVNLEIGKYKFPHITLPKEETPFSFLWKICFEGLSKRYQPITEKVVKRLQYELDVINELNFTEYFLIVADIVREAKRRGMMLIGRGSAANSLIAFCLEFTQVDPIENDLYFERFLNRGRLSPPDIDLDFSWKERDEIVKYVFEKFGYDKVAMISTTVTFRARSAFREVAKAFGFSNDEISKYSRFIPWTSAKNLIDIHKIFPETKSLDFEKEPWKTIVKYAARLADFPRYISIHPSGIVISAEPLTNWVSLEFAKNKGLGIIVTQPDMYSIEDLGLIKIDLLSQRALGVLRTSLLTINSN